MNLELAPNEEIILRAELNRSQWMRYRCASVATACIPTIVGAVLAPLYWLVGRGCRQSEAMSLELVLTNRNIHFRQKLYSCYGTCCQTTQTKIIPLEKIQDIALVSDCCGDTCRFADAPGDVYQMHFQTAGMGPIPELSVFCIRNPREFKRAVLEAKARVESHTHFSGQSKAVIVQSALYHSHPHNQQTPLMTNDQQDRLIRVLELLERQLVSPSSIPVAGNKE